jgi:hypothetical protein
MLKAEPCWLEKDQVAYTKHEAEIKKQLAWQRTSGKRSHNSYGQLPEREEVPNASPEE